MTSPDSPSAEQPDEQPAEQGDHAGNAGNAEAAKYRRQLRETEQHRDALTAAVERLQRAELGRLTASRLAQPEDLLTYGATLPDLLDEQGDLDAGKVDAAVTTVLAQRPGLAAVPPARFPDLGQGQRDSGPPAPDWAAVLRGR